MIVLFYLWTNIYFMIFFKTILLKEYIIIDIVKLFIMVIVLYYYCNKYIKYNGKWLCLLYINHYEDI